MFANALVLPYFDYLSIIWSRTDKSKLVDLDILHKKVAKIALDYKPRTESIKVYTDMRWLPLHLRRQVHYSNYIFRILHNQAPKQFQNIFSYVSGGSRDAEKCNLYITKSRSHKTFAYLGAKCWNLLADVCREFEDCKKFSKYLKSCFLNAIANDPLYTVDNKFDVFYTPAAFNESPQDSCLSSFIDHVISKILALYLFNNNFGSIIADKSMQRFPLYMITQLVNKYFPVESLKRSI